MKPITPRPRSAASEASTLPSTPAAPEESLRFSSSLLENLPGLVHCGINAPDRPTTYVSAGCEELTGWSPSDFTEQRIDLGRLIVEEDRERAWDQVRAALAGRRTFLVEYRIRTRDGEQRWVREKGWGVFDEAGNVLRIEGFLCECTREKRLEEQLLHAQKMEAVGLLAGGVAHDFNNLLTAVLGYGDMLASGLPRGSSEGRYARQVMHAAKRAADLTRRLLSFARKQEAHARVFDVNAQLLALDPLLRRLIGQDLEFVILAGEDVGPVEADPGQLEQVLVNLVVNARQAMPAGGKLTVATERVELARPPVSHAGSGGPGSWVSISVTDSGVGLRPEELERLFEPYYTTKPDGTGLGLSTCRTIVEGAGGCIEVDSSPGEGASFRLFLPRARPPGASSPDRERPPMRGGTEHVLLVDDDPLVRGVTETTLLDLGYTVLSARSAVEALELFEARPAGVHLLLSDVVMPLMSGRELARRLRARNPALPVVFISGYLDGSRGELEHGEAATRFLAKPFLRADLAACVRAALDAVAPA